MPVVLLYCVLHRFLGPPLADMIRNDVKPALMTAIDSEFAKNPKREAGAFVPSRASRVETAAKAAGGASGGAGGRGGGAKGERGGAGAGQDVRHTCDMAGQTRQHFKVHAHHLISC